MIKNILVTCPPMLKRLSSYEQYARENNINLCACNVVQTLSEKELIDILPYFDGCIIGDDPITYKVVQAGKNGMLKAIVKWGVGTDNIDFEATRQLQIKVDNTPGMFNKEVADVALCYLIGLARNLFTINNDVHKGEWTKTTGTSLEYKTVCLIGYGNIGKEIHKRLEVLSMNITVYDPYVFPTKKLEECLINVDFIIVACSLTKDNFHLLNYDNLKLTNNNLRIVNVSRGPLIDEEAVVRLQREGHIHSVAFDVFENEPLPINSKLRCNKNNLFGSHNASNTKEAVDKTSLLAIKKIADMLL